MHVAVNTTRNRHLKKESLSYFSPIGSRNRHMEKLPLGDGNFSTKETWRSL